MEKLEQQNITNNDCKSGWTDDDKRKIASVTFPLIEMQKAYGRQLDAKLVMQGWQAKLAHRYTVDEILFALDKYTDKHDDFPAPANLIRILNPEASKITNPEYFHAKEQWALNGYSPFCKHLDVIKAFERQSKDSAKEDSESREAFKIGNQELLEIAASSIKKTSS